MGDIADMVLEGALCEGCGDVLDGPNDPLMGPQRCGACGGSQLPPEVAGLLQPDWHEGATPYLGKKGDRAVACRECGAPAGHPCADGMGRRRKKGAHAWRKRDAAKDAAR